MISLTDRTITRGGRSWPVARWETWWRTPLGLHATLDEAAQLAPRMHVWVADKLPWVTISDALPQFAAGSGTAADP